MSALEGSSLVHHTAEWKQAACDAAFALAFFSNDGAGEEESGVTE